MSEHSHFPVGHQERSQQRIVEVLATGQVRSQTELADRLNADGLSVTQATLSRDLVEARCRRRCARRAAHWCAPYPARAVANRTPVVAKRVRRERGPAGAQPVLRADRLRRLFGEPVRAPHAARARDFLAVALDKAELSDVIGTVAGDDTVLVISREPAGGAALEQRLS